VTRATTCGKKEKGGLAHPFSTAQSTENAAAQPRGGVLGGKGQEPGQLGCCGGGEQVDRMGAPGRIESLAYGASQCPVGRWWVIGELREEGGCPKGRDRLLVASCRGLPADIDEHGASLVDVLLDRDALPIGLPRARARTTGVVGKASSGSINFFCSAKRMTRCFGKPEMGSHESSPRPYVAHRTFATMP